jgi:uncharacterized protein
MIQRTETAAPQAPSKPTPALTAQELSLLKGVFASHPEVTAVTLFGSRAMGTHTPQSDIDLALSGLISNLHAQAIAAELEELALPYQFDVQTLEVLSNNSSLREHIERVGIVLYP